MTPDRFGHLSSLVRPRIENQTKILECPFLASVERPQSLSYFALVVQLINIVFESCERYNECFLLVRSHMFINQLPPDDVCHSAALQNFKPQDQQILFCEINFSFF